MSNKKKLDSTSTGLFSNRVASSIQQATRFGLDEDLPESNFIVNSDSYKSISAQWTVFVWDHHCSRLRLVNRIVSECGATSFFLRNCK